jgi:hypothetical protein
LPDGIFSNQKMGKFKGLEVENIGKCNRIQTRQSLKIECFIFSVHTGLARALSTTLGETTWISETAK